MNVKYLIATAFLLLNDLAFAAAGGNPCGGGNSNSPACQVPEIDGALAIQAITLLGGVLYLLKRKK